MYGYWRETLSFLLVFELGHYRHLVGFLSCFWLTSLSALMKSMGNFVIIYNYNNTQRKSKLRDGAGEGGGNNIICIT